MNGKVYKKYFRITKVRNRQRVEPAAVQPIVMLTPHWGVTDVKIDILYSGNDMRPSGFSGKYKINGYQQNPVIIENKYGYLLCL